MKVTIHWYALVQKKKVNGFIKISIAFLKILLNWFYPSLFVFLCCPDKWKIETDNDKSIIIYQ